jgi:dolichol-phosphate mannosyltransferase
MEIASVPALGYSVVIPLFNEAEIADAMLSELNSVLKNLSSRYEIIAVDDGSTDSTLNVLTNFASRVPECRVLRLRKNQGQGAALHLGLKSAKAPVIITMDGDGQNDPHDIPRLIEMLAQADMVVGHRVNRQDSALRRCLSRIANHVRGRLLRDQLSDSGCALKILRREVVDALIPMRTLYSFLPALAVAGGFRVIELPVVHRPRKKGASKYGLRVFLWRPLLDLIGCWWFTRRCFSVRDVQKAHES